MENVGKALFHIVSHKHCYFRHWFPGLKYRMVLYLSWLDYPASVQHNCFWVLGIDSVFVMIGSLDFNLLIKRELLKFYIVCVVKFEVLKDN